MSEAAELDPGMLATANGTELSQAMAHVASPLVVWEDASGRILLGNHLAADLLGYPLSTLVGMKMEQVVEPGEGLGVATAALKSGNVDALSGHVEVRRRDGDMVSVYVWTRAIELDGTRCAVTLTVPAAEAAGLGRDPTRPWRQLVPVAVGAADLGWRIVALSADVGSVLGGVPSDWLNTSLVDVMHPSDRERVRDSLMSEGHPVAAWSGIHLRRLDGDWISACLLVSAVGSDDGRRMFAIVGHQSPAPSDRLSQLEYRLRRIGSEVRAAGLLENVAGVPSMTEFPQTADLTTRQWEILTRILRGQRVPSIAAELYLSRSTVRNHLTTIFRRFGVHSQPELIQLLGRPPDGFQHPA